MAVTKRVRKSYGKSNVSYHAEVYVRGVRIGERTFDTQAEAYAWHDQTKASWESGEAPAQLPMVDVTFGDCVARYVAEAMPRLRISSQQSFDARLRYMREAPIRNVRMQDFGPQAVDHWLSWLYQHPTKDNPGRKSFKHELKFLTVVLTWYRNYLDPRFVVPIVKRHRERCYFKHVAPRRPDYFIKPEELQAWITWLKNHRANPVYYRLATFIILTGTRVSEACGLCWDAVDLASGRARVIRTIRWDHHTRRPFLEVATKTEESVRMLPLARELILMLGEMRREAKGNGVIFHAPSGEPLKYNAIQSTFNAGFKALELPWRSTHICRHTFGTLALMATRDLSAVQASLGHRSRVITEKYAKTVAMLSSDTADKTADLIRLNHV